MVIVFSTKLLQFLVSAFLVMEFALLWALIIGKPDGATLFITILGLVAGFIPIGFIVAVLLFDYAVR